MLSIDILDLQRNNVFNKVSDYVWRITWLKQRRSMGRVLCMVESNKRGLSGVRFIYTVTNRRNDKSEILNYVIPVVSTRCNYGGHRWWFTCPLVVNGCACRRRCRILYLPPDSKFFGCRECHQLSYGSRQRHREKFFEWFEKPYKTAKSANEAFEKVRSWKKKEILLQKLMNACAVIERFQEVEGISDRGFRRI